MGVQPPFLYDKPSAYTFAGPTQRSFDPKAATRASWTPPAPKPKRDGPLIDFNKHPDSYVIVPYGNLNVEPMNPKTKVRVKRTRKLQNFLRFLALLGALGLLFCVIVIRNTSTSAGWIIRVGPAVAICHCLYAIHHLRQDAASRSPTSAASYMIFAALIDSGLLPFFAFSAIMANEEYTTDTYGWTTVFADSNVGNKIMFAFFLTCATEGGLILISLILDIYLTVVFRKIARMPPDMNPLEDNLTARPNGKHKRNKSELNFEKHLSGSTLATQRMSQISNPSQTNFKRVPYVHTRTDSADSITLYGNERALNSRVSLRNEIKEANNFRDSVASSRTSLSPTRPSSAITPAANARTPGAGLDHKPIRSSTLAQEEGRRQASWLSYSNVEGVPTPLSQAANEQLDHEIRPLSPVSMMSDHDIQVDRLHVERLNWYHGSPHNSVHAQGFYTQPNISAESFEQETTRLSVVSPHQRRKRSRDPLGMNPPTPVLDRFRDENEYESPAQTFSTPQRQALDEVPANSSGRPGMGSRPSSFIGSGGKSRYYGDLRNSLGGSPTREHFDSPTKQPQQDDIASIYSHTRTMESEESGNFIIYDSEDDGSDLEDHQRQLHQDDQSFHEHRRQPGFDMLSLSQDQDQWNGARKVSNSTGYDLKSGYAGLEAEFGVGMARRREVSGKVAEEGRGGTGYGNIGVSETKDGAVITGQGQRNGAAGWARFHGL